MTGPGLFLIQKQLQVLKPQQILVANLLQLPMLLLEQKIQMELQLNPVLEEEWEAVQEDEDDELKEQTEEAENIREEFATLEENNKSEEEKRNDKVQEDVNIDELLPDDDNLREPYLPTDHNERIYDQPEPDHATMSELLLDQLQLLNLQEIDLQIGKYIIYSLRDDGYLDFEVDVESIAQVFETTPESTERVLKLIQELNPPGIAARNLQECLIIQLDQKNENNKYAIPLLILKDCFQDFVDHRYEQVADQLEISADQVKDALAVIGKLNPKPGEDYSDAKRNHIIPDFYVEKLDDELVIYLNDHKIPGLRISHYYKKMIRHPQKLDNETRKFLKEKVNSAKWFIKAIQQRRATMQRTMEAIVDKQRMFFENGPENIKPLIMKDIAREIEMDISTVSRVCKGKYVDTDFGVFELKYFFNEGMETDEGEVLSTTRIKERLKEIITAENPRKPLSDITLGKMLNKERIPIARRTVTKYREQLDISMARLRRSI